MSPGPQPAELQLQIQQRMLAELSAAERRYRTLVERLQDVVIECHPDGRIRYLNGAWTQALGYPVDACQGRWLREFLHRPEAGLELLGETHREVCLRHRDGHPVWFELSLSRNADTLVGLLYNVDRRKEAEWALEAARDTALEAARLRSEFLANMSHEIRTPLHGLMGMLDLLAQGDLDAEHRQYARTAQDSARHLLTLLNDILDLSRIEAGGLQLEFAPVDLRELAGDCLRLMQVRAQEKGIGLHLEAAPDLPSAFLADAARLRQVLFNLVSNAVKFTEQGTVSVRLSRSGDEVSIQVADTGIGIPPERREAIFQAFTQADGSITRRYGGTGLGLAISARLAQAMGGGIEVDSEPGAGSVFTLRLPLQVVEAPALDEAGAEKGEADTGALAGAHVLVVEDNPVNRTLARVMLEKLGCRVTLAEDGAEGVARAARERFDVIVMDCQMPVMDGFEAARRIREGGESALTPIVAVTANVLPEDQAQCLEVMDDYLAKPLALDAFAGCLAHWVGREAPV